MIATHWLILADQTVEFIHDPKCLKLADLHSAAVDYPKSGIPVSVNELPWIPKPRPDWSAPEVGRDTRFTYYISERALGKLFRAIDLPMIQEQDRRTEHFDSDDDDLDLNHGMNALSLRSSHSHDAISTALFSRISEFMDDDELETDSLQFLETVAAIFANYSRELSHICRNHSLSPRKGARLSEREVLVGTIVAKTSHSRRRKDLMSQMREHTAALANQVREDISGGKDSFITVRLRRSWAAWKVSQFYSTSDSFGAKSFGFIAIGCVFDAVNAFES
jgi:hypothetical protein